MVFRYVLARFVLLSNLLETRNTFARNSKHETRFAESVARLIRELRVRATYLWPEANCRNNDGTLAAVIRKLYLQLTYLEGGG